MPIFDGCVFPYPSGQVSSSRFARDLQNLGFSGCVMCGTVPEKIRYGMPVLTARYLSGIQPRLLSREIGRSAIEHDLVYVQAGDAGFNRTAIQTTGIHVLTDIQNTPKDGFDRYCAQLAADRGVAIDLSVRPLVELRDVARQKVIRKYEELFTLQNRYEFPLMLSSHASEIWHLKSPREMIRLFSLICDDEDLIRSSLGSISQVKQRVGPVREV